MASNEPHYRTLPNILVTGTPGVGKSTLCYQLSSMLDLPWLKVAHIAEANNFFEGYDKTYCCPILDENKLLDHMEPKMSEGGYIVEYHSCEFFPERWFDVVYVLSVNTECLFDRLAIRHYSKKKLRDNIECEIFNMILEEARDNYDNNIVICLKNNTIKDLQNNVKTVCDWVRKWKPVALANVK